MAVDVLRPAVTTSATLVATVTDTASATAGASDAGARTVLVKNVTGSASVFLGPAGVTTANGFEWEASDGPCEFTLEPGESLYGIVASVTQTLHVIGQGR